MNMWRWMPPVDGPGAWQMAADMAVLEAVRDGDSGPVVRVYRWTPPCVTLGKFQKVDGNVQVDNCARLGIDIARRPTGGRAILHDHEVTFSIIIAERDLPGAGANVMESYRALGTALVAGLRQLGLPAELVDRHSPPRDAPTTTTGNPACFAAKARCDLMVNGSKLIGSAQMRRDGVILQQNSLPLTVDFPKWEDVFYQSDWKTVSQGVATDLWTAAGREIAYDEVVAALALGFRDALGAQLMEDALSSKERDCADALQQEFVVLAT